MHESEKGSSVLVTCLLKFKGCFTRVDMTEEEKGGDVRVVFCPSFDLFHSTLPPLELKGYPVCTAAGVLFLPPSICQAVEGRAVFGWFMCETDWERL